MVKTEPLRKIKRNSLIGITVFSVGITGCGERQATQGDADLDLDFGGASITSGAASGAVNLVIDGESRSLGYILNCTISPSMSGAVVTENNDGENPGAMLRVNAFTVDGATGAQVSFREGDLEYTFEGPISLGGKTFSWSGEFQKLDMASPRPNELGMVPGSFSIAC